VPLTWGLKVAIAETASPARDVRAALHTGDSMLAETLFTAALKGGTATAGDYVAVFAAVITGVLSMQEVWLAAEPRDPGPAERNAVAFTRGLTIAITRARR
jgi:cephalosporin hydroxylase